MRQFLSALRGLDWPLLTLMGLLVAFGLVMLYSLTLNVESPDYAAFRDQAIFAILGVAVLLAVAVLDYRYFRSYAWVLYVLGALLLVGVLLFGTEIRGVQSWFVIGPVTFQPVELAKIFLLLFFAKYFSEHPRDVFEIRHLLISGGATMIYVLLVMLQPDLGSAIILLGLFLAMVLLVNIRRSHLVLLVALLIASLIIGWLFVLQDYQKDRILVLVDPNRDPLGQGYNVQQSLVAIGSGGLFGRGLGLGSQSQLNFLPEQKTDFIFAAIAEELGLIGASILLILLLLLFLRLYRVASSSRDPFAAFFVFGVLVILLIQVIMNVGMNVGLLPVAGVPLPFVSAGGSSLITLLLLLGVVQSIVIRKRSERFQTL